MNYGDLGKRIIAYFIDGILISLVTLILYFIFFPFYYFAAYFIIAPLVFVGTIVYYIAMEGGGWHATLGKRAMGLYVASEDGSGITYSKAMLRYIGKIFSGLIFGIGYLMGAFSEKKQCLHDIMANTYVLEGASNAGKSGMPRLVCVSGPLAGTSYAVSEKGVVIGRDSLSCQVVLPASQSSVSRVHCFVSYNKVSGMFILSDRNSSQGTYLADGRRIPYSQPIALSSGDSFYLASPQNTFKVC